jgi:hypothetical protein
MVYHRNRHSRRDRGDGNNVNESPSQSTYTDWSAIPGLSVRDHKPASYDSDNHWSYIQGLSREQSSSADTSSNTSRNISTDSDEMFHWSGDKIALAVIIPTVLIVLIGIAFRHCYVANKRHAELYERRQSIRAAQRAQTREERREADRKRKERVKDVEAALVSSVSCGFFRLLYQCSFLPSHRNYYFMFLS